MVKIENFKNPKNWGWAEFLVVQWLGLSKLLLLALDSVLGQEIKILQAMVGPKN